jgi:hypothetical protein
MQLASGASLRARVLRIGADFVEVESAGAAQTPTVIAFGAVLAVRV